LLPRGGGTSLSGQSCNVAVIVDFSKYLNQIIEINPQEKYAWVQPGCVLDKLRNRANEFNLTFGPDPSTHEYCNLGGMIGNNSCGAHSVMAGAPSTMFWNSTSSPMMASAYASAHFRRRFEQIVRAGARGNLFALQLCTINTLISARSRYQHRPCCSLVSFFPAASMLPNRWSARNYACVVTLPGSSG
jgi:hypothetical protein